MEPKVSSIDSISGGCPFLHFTQMLESENCTSIELQSQLQTYFKQTSFYFEAFSIQDYFTSGNPVVFPLSNHQKQAEIREKTIVNFYDCFLHF